MTRRKFVSETVWRRAPGLSLALAAVAAGQGQQADELKVLTFTLADRRLTPGEDPGGLAYVTSYQYDALNNLKKVEQKGSTGVPQLTRTFEYDSLKQLRKAVNPERGVTRLQYDPNGNLLERKEFESPGATTPTATIAFNHDALNRVIRKYHNGTQVATWCTDGQTYSTTTQTCTGSTVAASMGKVTAHGSSESVTSFEHDAYGRISKSKQATPPAITTPYEFVYTYYLDESVATMRYPSGKVLAHCYDTQGRLAWLSKVKTSTDCTTGSTPVATDSYAVGLQYQPFGGIKELRLGNNLYEVTGYNTRQQVESIQLGTSTITSDVWREAYQYQSLNNGNLSMTTLQLPGGSNIQAHYRYDNLNRLTTVAETPVSTIGELCVSGNTRWCQQFGYEERGNRRLVGSFGLGTVPQAPLAFGLDNRVTGSGWSYGTRGNLGSIPSGVPNGDKYLYDAEDRMTVSCSGMATCDATADSSKTFYQYDAEGRRVKKVRGAESTVYVYDAAGRLGAEYGGATAQSGVAYVTGDRLSSVRVVTNSAGVALERHDYAPYGEELSVSGSNPRVGVVGYGGTGWPTQRFTGKERDAVTGLDYFGARYFSGAQGRFTSPDKPFADQTPIDPQSWNLYSYVRNQPLRAVDADGRTMIDAVRLGQYITGFVKGTANRMIENAAQLAQHGDPVQRVVNSAVQTDFRFSSSTPIEESGMQAGYNHGETVIGAAMAVGGKFSSKDPLVGKLVNEIEATYPGHVKGVNVPVKRSDGTTVTDADIVTGNAIIQVKSGGGKGLGDQVARTEGASGMVTIGYGPDLKPSVVKDVQSRGGLVTRSKETLIRVIKPDEK